MRFDTPAAAAAAKVVAFGYSCYCSYVTLAATLLLLCHHQVMGFASSYRTTGRQGARYFAQELLLPPLPSLWEVSNSKNDRQQQQQATVNNQNILPVLYTNDPMKFSQWLGDHIPNDGCTLGFDVEVSFVIFVKSAIDSPMFVWSLSTEQESRGNGQ